MGVRREALDARILMRVARGADMGKPEQEIASAPLRGPAIHLRMTMGEGAVARFSYSTDGRRFTTIGEPFAAKPGRWVGAKIGLFATGPATQPGGGYADVDWFRIAKGPA